MIWTISQLNGEISRTLRGHKQLQDCWLTGEISNFKNHLPSGHWYFTLKDQRASMRCVMFQTQNHLVEFVPAGGLKILARGSVRIYEKDGNVQIYVEEMYPSGLGALYLAFEQLKSKLAQEGLFAPERKRAIPAHPRRIGVITSPTGAVLRDILQIAGRRNPAVAFVVIPAAVQGQSAPEEIAKALRLANRWGDLDLLILARGGGSLEELWAFNTEVVARAVVASQIPVISAVGHETDVTIADFVADLRAPTPSGAAELAVPVRESLCEQLILYGQRLKAGLGRVRDDKRALLRDLENREFFRKPQLLLVERYSELDQISMRLETAFRDFLAARSGALNITGAKLQALSPLQTLSRGYCLVYNEDGVLQTTVTGAAEGQKVSVRLRDGCLSCRIEEIWNEDEGLAGR